VLFSLHRYFLSLGRSSPLVGLEADLLARIASCEQILLEALAAIGHLLFEGCESQTYIQARQVCLRLSFNEPPTGDAQKTLDFCMAMVLISYVEYGANNIPEASRCMQIAFQVALYLQLNVMDSQASNSHFAQLCHANEIVMERGRRVWWELFIAEIVLKVATSGKIGGIMDPTIKTEVHTPCIPGSENREAYQMRIRAALLMNETTNLQQAPLDPMDSIIANTISSVQDRWLSHSLLIRNNASTTLETTFTLQSVLFQALLMLHG
jgi:hypothetical protein